MRRPARNQPLPEEEAQYLRELKGVPLKMRARRLYEAGWTLSSIGAPINRSRSTIRFWVNNVPELTATTDRPLPSPIDKSYKRKRPISPGISPDELNRIAYLAPIARTYRAKFPKSHPATQANEELTTLSKRLHKAGVPIQEVADAAGVTYRAMYRRIHSNER